MGGKQPSEPCGSSYKLSEEQAIRHSSSCWSSTNGSATGTLTAQSCFASLSKYFTRCSVAASSSFYSREVEIFRGRLKCLLFLRLLRKQKAFEMRWVKHILLLDFNKQVRVCTSMSDPINLTDCNTGVSPLSFGVWKSECKTGVEWGVTLANPEAFNFGNSPPGGPRCFVFSWTFLRERF